MRTVPDEFLLCDLVYCSGAPEERVALHFTDDVVTYGELVAESLACARGFLELGIEPGDRVAVFANPSRRLVTSLFGLGMIGATIVPVNTRYQPYELEYVLGHCGARAVVTSGSSDPATQLGRTLAVVDPNRADAPLVLDLAGTGVDGTVPFHSFVESAASRDDAEVHARRQAVAYDDPAFICYTSGTTSRPKGVVLSHGIVRGYITVAKSLGVGPADVLYSPTPMFHLSGLGALLMAVRNGATLVACAYFDPDDAIEQLAAQPPTVLLTLFPPLTVALLQHPKFDRDLFRDVRIAVHVGPAEMQQRVERALPNGRVVSTFGLTESGSGLSTLGSIDDPLELRAATCGRPLPGTEVRIADPETGEVLGSDVAGEIQLRAFDLPGRPYYADDDATARVSTADGWLKTGDRGYLTAEGCLVFQDRLKDMLRVGGENVSPAEIESVLAEHDAVAMAQVVGLPDDRLDEVPVAFVELAPGRAATEAELLDHCARLARFKRPRHVVIVDEWPTSATKIQKSQLRELAVERLLGTPA